MRNAEDQNNREVSELLGAYEAMLEGEGGFFLEEKDIEQLIDYFEGSDMYERAMDLVEIAIEYFPYASGLLLRKAALLLARQEASKALELLDHASLLSPNAFEIELLRAEALIYMDAFQEANELLDSLQAEASSDVDLADVCCVRSLIYEGMGDYDGMFESLRQTLAYDPSHEEAVNRLGIATEATRRYAESIAIYETLLEQDAYLYHVWYFMGLAQAYEGRYEEALEAFEYAFLIHPAYEPAYREFAELCFETKAYERALKALEDMRAQIEIDSDLLLYLGKCHSYMGDEQQARKIFLQVLVLDPMQDEAYFSIGKSYAAEGSWPLAAYYFQKALDIDEEMEEYLGAQGEAHFRMGMYDTAEALFQRAIMLAPEEPVFWRQCALTLLEGGRPAEAIEILEEAAEWTWDTELTFLHAACLYALGKKSEAMEKLNEALEEYTGSFGTLFQLLPELESDPDVQALVAYLRP